jgi:EPS-associated MarR family transcriptional regulator
MHTQSAELMLVRRLKKSIQEIGESRIISVHLLNKFRMEDEIHYRLLKLLEETPDVTQRELAARLDISLGKANYCLRALTARGWVKMDNFRRNPSKIGYVYLLTPKGIEEKARMTMRFLRHKLHEFDALKAEIERLQTEVGNSMASEQVQLESSDANKGAQRK